MVEFAGSPLRDILRRVGQLLTGIRPDEQFQVLKKLNAVHCCYSFLEVLVRPYFFCEPACRLITKEMVQCESICNVTVSNPLPVCVNTSHGG